MTRMLNHMPASFLVLNNDKRKIYWLYQGSCPSLLIFYMKLTPIYPRCKMFISIKQTIFTWWISTGESYIGAIIKALFHLIIIDIPTLFEIILDCKFFFYYYVMSVFVVVVHLEVQMFPSNYFCSKWPILLKF